LKALIIFMAFFLIEAVPALSQESGLADDLFKSGDYYRAITEYKRFSFFSAAGEEKRQASFRIGESFRKSGRLEESIPYFLESADFQAKDALTDSSGLSMARVLIGMGCYDTARHVLDAVRPEAGSEKAALTGWTYFLEGDYMMARQNLGLARASSDARKLANLCIGGADPHEVRERSRRDVGSGAGDRTDLCGWIRTGHHLHGIARADGLLPVRVSERQEVF
jgi:tetratricopeptide (TPR) repeat protein